MNLERTKIVYVFEEGSNPNKDMEDFFQEIRDFYFIDWVKEVFFQEYDEEGYELWNDEPDSVIETFMDTNREQIAQYMTDLQKKVFFHPQTQEEFKNVLDEVDV